MVVVVVAVVLIITLCVVHLPHWVVILQIYPKYMDFILLPLLTVLKDFWIRTSFKI